MKRKQLSEALINTQSEDNIKTTNVFAFPADCAVTQRDFCTVNLFVNSRGAVINVHS